MRINGSFSYEVTSPGGVNRHGEPIAATTAWSDPINCSIKANYDTRKGKYEDGKFRQASFVVLIESREIDMASIKRLRIMRGRENLGEYDVLSIEPLTSVGRIQITV